MRFSGNKITVIAIIIACLVSISIFGILDYLGYVKGIYSTYQLNQMVKEANRKTVTEDPDETKTIKTTNETISYTIANDDIYAATVNMSFQSWENIVDKEKEDIIKKIVENTVDSIGWKTVIGISSNKKLLFIYEGKKDKCTIKINP